MKIVVIGLIFLILAVIAQDIKSKPTSNKVREDLARQSAQVSTRNQLKETAKTYTIHFKTSEGLECVTSNRFGRATYGASLSCNWEVFNNENK